MFEQDNSESAANPALPKDAVLHITVLIATRNRPDDLERCLDSLTRLSYPHWDILLVDQSDNVNSQEVAQRFCTRLPNLAYHHVHTSGKCRALNVGLREACGAVIGILDDDCSVDPNWLNDVAAVFARHTDAALVYGALKSALPDTIEYFVPTFEVPEEVALDGPRAFFAAPGYGASMYLRLAACQAVGAFDTHMGPGSDFYTSDDWDYHYRTLLAGGRVVMTPSVVVWHYGARSYKGGAASHLYRIGFFSHGALDMKLLRAGHLIALRLIGMRIRQNVLAIQWRNVLLRRSPTGLSRIAMYLSGLIASFRLGVDRQRCLYLPIEREDVEAPGRLHCPIVALTPNIEA
jgi:GT2 family glycosyltransferase